MYDNSIYLTKLLSIILLYFIHKFKSTSLQSSYISRSNAHRDIPHISLIFPQRLNELKARISLPVDSAKFHWPPLKSHSFTKWKSIERGVVSTLPIHVAARSRHPRSLIPAISSFRRSRLPLFLIFSFSTAHTRSFARSPKGDMHCCFCSRANRPMSDSRLLATHVSARISLG